MNPNAQARCDARARVFKALGHPARLYMVEELGKGERCVCELTELLGLDMSTVSRHLAVLKAAGVVDDEKRGLQVFYHLKVPCVLNLFGCVEGVLESNAQAHLAAVGKA
ncbi:MAG TPA: metalloregulator ArsR/SmtB family transcription factor [Candidatus Hydrogenedentes bacterium]|nr:metalloregulator ArsR/SmtB family transcription factor [Candidatus Hydrogenedentota bacterium]